jgi:hypothetical protein
MDVVNNPSLKYPLIFISKAIFSNPEGGQSSVWAPTNKSTEGKRFPPITPARLAFV